jgi:formiminotetrahydrofolate cyclodeaminase
VSAVSDFLAEPTFWWGGLAGAIVTSVVAPLITARSVRASDKRKFEQENSVLDRKFEQERSARAEQIAREDKTRAEQIAREDAARAEQITREDKLRRDESLYAAATEFTDVCTDILMNSIDVKGAFNAIRDMFYNRAGLADSKADDKLDHATKVAEQNKRIAMPFNKLRLVAPNNVLEAGSRLNAAMLAVLRTTTEPFAMPVTLKAAGDELDSFINIFRAEVGRDEYARSTAQEQAVTFLGNLKKQVDAYMQEAKAEMRAASFTSTPWDNMGQSAG